ncbi:MAG: hypothetical protein WB679_26485 [Terracidiphilus sp.]
MTAYDRRTFLQLSAAAMLAATSRKLSCAADAPSITSTSASVVVKCSDYSWVYTQADDTFRLYDKRNRLMVSGRLQPLVLVALASEPNARQCSPGNAAGHRVEGGRVIFDYEGVNGAAHLSSEWRFDDQGIWVEPIVYEAPAGHDVVSLHYFCQQTGDNRIPTLHSSYQIVPGVLPGSSVSPIVGEYVHLDENVWLGRGSFIASPSNGACRCIISADSAFTTRRGSAGCTPMEDRMLLPAAWRICREAISSCNCTKARAVSGSTIAATSGSIIAAQGV